MKDYADSFGMETSLAISVAQEWEAGNPASGAIDPGEEIQGGWGFRQRLENDQMSVCLEAGDAVSAQARLTNSGEVLHFALYLETRH